ncbi:MAG: hypothetical protein WDO13_02080 [Verrucomicrobiota bacterium]
MIYLLFLLAPASALYALFWCRDSRRAASRQFFAKLRQLSPQSLRQLRDPALSRRERGRNVLTFLQSEQYAEFGDPEITRLGRQLERLHVGGILLSMVIFGYSCALIISSFLSHS